MSPDLCGSRFPQSGCIGNLDREGQSVPLDGRQQEFRKVPAGKDRRKRGKVRASPRQLSQNCYARPRLLPDRRYGTTRLNAAGALS